MQASYRAQLDARISGVALVALVATGCALGSGHSKSGGDDGSALGLGSAADVELVATTNEDGILTIDAAQSSRKLGHAFLMIDPYTSSFWTVGAPVGTADLMCLDEYLDGDPPLRRRIPVSASVNSETGSVVLESTVETTSVRRVVASVTIGIDSWIGLGQFSAEYKPFGQTQWFPASRSVVAIQQPVDAFFPRVNAMVSAGKRALDRVEKR